MYIELFIVYVVHYYTPDKWLNTKSIWKKTLNFVHWLPLPALTWIQWNGTRAFPSSGKNQYASQSSLKNSAFIEKQLARPGHGIDCNHSVIKPPSAWRLSEYQPIVV